MMVRQDRETGVWYPVPIPTLLDIASIDSGSSGDSESESGLDEASGRDIVDSITGLECRNPDSSAGYASLFGELYSGQNCSYGGWHGLNDNSYCSPGGRIDWSNVVNLNLVIGAALPVLYTIPVVPWQVGAGVATGAVLNLIGEMARNASDRTIVNIGEIMMP